MTYTAMNTLSFKTLLLEYIDWLARSSYNGVTSDLTL